MSVNIKIRNAIKRYGANTVISGLSLDIKEGEFFTLLGPSGCGKTTLLRMIAGFNTIEGGDFYFNENRINDLDPAKRNIGMVFQNYAIFPHLTVFKNVSFGLKNRKYEKQQLTEQTLKFLELMQIEAYKDRLPEFLSGGQQQRVALARALVIQPAVLLMDEPLSNLDAKLRVEMRTVIKDIQMNVGITTVYVTHDQEEAMAISDRIAIMKEGVIQHIGSPKDIYQRPANLFVAQFIGSTNVVNGRLNVDSKGAFLQLQEGVPIPLSNLASGVGSQDVIVSIRPEEMEISTETQSGIDGVVENYQFLGLNTIYFIRMFGNRRLEIVQESTIDNIIQPGTKVSLHLKSEKINVFNTDGSVNLLSGVNNDLHIENTHVS